MTHEIVSPAWKLLGSTSNADFYEIQSDLMAIVPHRDASDDESSARESLSFQQQHWSRVGHRGGVVIFMDPLLAQDSGARSVYANETSQSLSTCFALVSKTMFAQASSSVFVGLAKPGIPTEVFSSFEAARPWIEEMTKARGGRVRS